MKYKQWTMDEIRDASKLNKFNVVSTFAGGGGSSMGYRMAGGHILGINEFVEQAQKTYAANFPDTHIFPQDVRELTGKEILDTLGLKKGELDIFDGSPPCSAFSLAGKREEGWGVEKKYSTGKNQVVDDLFFEYIRIMDEIQPKIFVAENVKGLTIGNAKDYLLEILTKMRKCGYEVQYRVLNAADYGTPQKRERVIFVGVRNDIYEDNDDLSGGWVDLFPEKTYKPTEYISIKTAFSGLIQPDPVKDFPVGTKTRILYDASKEGAQFSDAHEELYGTGSWFSHIRLHRDKASSTLTTAWTGFCHWDEPRPLTIGEYQRIMGVPDDYINLGAANNQYERIGRMVAPPMYWALSDHLYNVILKPLKDQDEK